MAGSVLADNSTKPMPTEIQARNEGAVGSTCGTVLPSLNYSAHDPTRQSWKPAMVAWSTPRSVPSCTRVRIYLWGRRGGRPSCSSLPAHPHFQNPPEPELYQASASALIRLAPMPVIWKVAPADVSGGEAAIAMLQEAGPNLHIFSWVPQVELLQTGRVRAMLGHGGINSIYEARPARHGCVRG